MLECRRLESGGVRECIWITCLEWNALGWVTLGASNEEPLCDYDSPYYAPAGC